MTLVFQSIIIDPLRHSQQTAVASEGEFVLVLGIYFCILWVFLAKRNFQSFKDVPSHVSGRRKAVSNFKRIVVVS